MRFFTLLITGSAIVISANASITQKRAFSSAFYTCSGFISGYKDDIGKAERETNRIEFDSKYLNERLDEYIYVDHSNLVGWVGYCCKTFVPHMNDEDARAIAVLMTSTVNEYNKLILALIGKKDTIEKDADSLEYIQMFTNIARARINNFSECVAPGNTALLDIVNDSYSKLKTVYHF